MLRPTVLLFDIDGTMLSTDGAGRRAIDGAIVEVTGRANPRELLLDGMTDRAIVRGVLREMAWPEGDLASAIDRVLSAYLAFLKRELDGAAEILVYPGVRELLETARARPSLALGLGTGNIEQGAFLKLRRVGLDGYFAFGGYGSDDEDRAALIRKGAERGAARLGLSLGECRVVVIGDTPRDIAAAAAVGAECVAVATGRFGVAELSLAGARSVFASLADPEAQRAILAD